jgi:predicted Zn-dependent protease
VLVTEVGGLLAADPRSPRITLAVRGWRIVGGAPAHAVAGPLVSASLWEVLHNVREVGEDLQFWPGASVNAGSPSLLVEAAAFPGKEDRP